LLFDPVWAASLTGLWTKSGKGSSFIRDQERLRVLNASEGMRLHWAVSAGASVRRAGEELSQSHQRFLNAACRY
jgi:hypothetical protein